MASVSDVISLVVFLIVGLVSVVTFEIAIQPMLVWVDPMFADDIISIPGRSSNSAAQIAMGLTFVAFSIIEISVISPLIDPYLPDSFG